VHWVGGERVASADRRPKEGTSAILADPGGGEMVVDQRLNSPLLKCRFDQAGSSATTITRMAKPSPDAATRMVTAASSVWTKSR
jgi:hypothetical protein